MLYLKKLYLDGTPLEDIVTVAEFSRQHAAPALSWSLGSDRPDGTQTAYTLTLTDLDSRKVLYESGRVETAAQTATFPAGDFPAGALLHADLLVEDDAGGTATGEELFFNGALDAFPGTWISSQEDEGNRVLHFYRDFVPSSRWRTRCCIPAGWATTRRT